MTEGEDDEEMDAATLQEVGHNIAAVYGTIDGPTEEGSAVWRERLEACVRTMKILLSQMEKPDPVVRGLWEAVLTAAQAMLDSHK